MKIKAILEGKNNLITFLNEKGFEEQSDYTDNEYPHASYFHVGEKKLLVIYEIYNKDEFKDVKNHFLIDRGLNYCIIIIGNKLIFSRNFGDPKHFIYSDRTSDVISKIDRLDKMDEKGFDYIFQAGKDLSEQFYELFKSKRDLLVRNITNKINPTQKYLIAQKIFDRFFFIYFLCNKEIIKDNGHRISGETLFKILREGKFVDNLNTFFEKFNLSDTSNNVHTLKINDHNISIPYLNGGLFRSDNLEQYLDISLTKKQWNDIFEFLNSYHWIIEDTAEDSQDQILTPEILGHVYERSVVEWEKKDFEEVAEQALGKTTERKKLGVYYTPESITEYICRHTIYPYILDNLDKKYCSFNELIECGTISEYKKALKILDDIKLLDPACGSGAFLIKSAEIIFSMKRQLCYQLDISTSYYDLKLDIITENIYGVDILDGAVELSKLRLWLWLISDFNEDDNKINALPNIEYNLKVGNSLIGWFDETFSQMVIIHCDTRINEIITNLIPKYNDQTQKNLNNVLKLLKDSNLDNYVKAYYLLYKIYRREHGPKADNLRDILNTLRQSIYKTATPTFLNYLNYNKQKKFVIQKPSITEEDFKSINPFHWKIDFGYISQQGGFNVIVGNPPYRKISPKQMLKNIPDSSLLRKGQLNMGALFIKKSINLLSERGYLGIIIPKSFLHVKSWGPIRDFVLKYSLIEVNDVGKKWKEVGLEQTIIISVKDHKSINTRILHNSKMFCTLPQKIFIDRGAILTYVKPKILKIIKKIENNTVRLDKIAEIGRGSEIDKKKYLTNYPSNRIQVFGGSNVERFLMKDGSSRKPNQFIQFDDISVLSKENVQERIIYQRITSSHDPKIIATYVDVAIHTESTLIDVILTSSKYSYKDILAILNSDLITFYLQHVIINNARLSVNLDRDYVGVIPIKNSQNDLSELVSSILKNKCTFNEYNKEFLSYINRKIPNIQSSKLRSYYTQNFYDFMKQVEISKNKISPKIKEEIKDHFNHYVPLINDLLYKITMQTDEINEKIFKLYELDLSEIKYIKSKFYV